MPGGPLLGAYDDAAAELACCLALLSALHTHLAPSTPTVAPNSEYPPPQIPPPPHPALISRILLFLAAVFALFAAMSGMPRPDQYRSFYPFAKAYKRGPVTVEAPGYEPVEGETIPRRNIKHKDALRSQPNDEISTAFELLKWASAKYGNAKAVGYRKLVKIHTETKKVKKLVDGKEQEVDKEWTYSELGPYDYMSFVEFEKLSLTLGSAFRKLGLGKGDKIQLFAATRYVLTAADLTG